MKPAERPSYVRVLATVIGMLGRRAPLPLVAEVVVGVVLMAANVLVFFLLERVMAQVAGGGGPAELVAPILVVGAVIVLREYFKETRILGAGAFLLERYRAAIGRFNAARWREDVRLGVIDLALNVLVLVGYGGSFLLAALLLASGSIGVGGFAVVIYAVSRLMMMTRAVMSMLGTSHRSSVTAAHLLEFLRLDEGRQQGGSTAARSAANLTAREVAFAYPGSERDAVSGVDLELDRGTTLALVGANGAGKTTLAKLLLGLYVPTTGRVDRDGVDTREATRSGIRAATSAVFQNYQRYQMSLRDNVILADTGAAEDEGRVLRALRDGGVPEELWHGPRWARRNAVAGVRHPRPVAWPVAAAGDCARAVPGAPHGRAGRTDGVDRPVGGAGGVRAVHENRGRAHRHHRHPPPRLGAAGRPYPCAGRRACRRRRHPRAASRPSRPLPPHVHRPGRLVPEELKRTPDEWMDTALESGGRCCYP